jgi:hypothetical protein
MLPPVEVDRIKAEIQRLAKLRQECRDSGILECIDGWIKSERKKLDAIQQEDPSVAGPVQNPKKAASNTAQTELKFKRSVGG